jgi:hypothetical protein
MCRIEFAEHRAVQPLIGSNVAEFRATEDRRFPLRRLNALHAAANAHGALPRGPVMPLLTPVDDITRTRICKQEAAPRPFERIRHVSSALNLNW